MKVGKELGLEGGELQTFVQEQQALEIQQREQEAQQREQQRAHEA